MTSSTSSASLPNTDAGRIVSADDLSIAARYKLNDIFCQAWLSHAVTALANHGVPDCIEEEPMSVETIAKLTELDSASLYRALRATAANEIFAEVRPGYFAHTAASRLLRSSNDFSWRGMASMWNHPSCLQAWRHFGGTLQDGRSGIEHAFGKTLYEHLHDDPSACMAFSDAMISNSAHAAGAIANTFPFEKFSSFVDLGGGVGTLLVAILAAHKEIQGTIYEIQDLQEAATSALREAELGGRGSVAIGNFLESVPPGFALYLVKNSLWNWDDNNCSAIIKNVRTAIGADRSARFMIIEYMIRPDNAKWSTLYDLQILNMPGGRSRTENEYKNLLDESGFDVEEIFYVEDQTVLVAKPQ